MTPADQRESALGTKLVRLWPFAVFGALFAVIAALVVALETDPLLTRELGSRLGVGDLRYNSRHVATFTGLLSFATALGILSHLAIRYFFPVLLRTRAARIAIPGLVIAATLVGCFNYLYLSRGTGRIEYHKFHDSFHYLLGPKYYGELGYFDLYTCVLRADAASSRRLRKVSKVRDLRNYRVVPVADAVEAAGDCRERFSDERWREFQHDVEVYMGSFRKRTKLFRDHGYNGTPFHAAVAGSIANTFELSYSSMTLAALLDVLALLAACACAVYFFGWRVGLLMALFLSVNFSDRFYFIGGSFFRYYWLAFVIGFLCALSRGRYALAAALLTVASMLNVFPLLFASAIGLKIVLELVRTRQLSPRYRQFILGGALATVVCGGISLTHDRGWQNYREFFRIMDYHPKLITSSRVGFRYLFLHRDEIRRSDPYYSRRAKRRELQAMTPWRLVLTTGILLFGFAVVSRLDDIEGSVLGGMLLFFFLFGTVEYYYAVSAVLLLLWHRRRGPPGAQVLIASLFALQALIYWCWLETNFLKFCNNTVTSFGLAAVLLATLVYLANDTGLLRQPFAPPGERAPGSGPRARPHVLAIAWLVAALVLPAAYFVGQAYREKPRAAARAANASISAATQPSSPRRPRSMSSGS